MLRINRYKMCTRFNVYTVQCIPYRLPCCCAVFQGIELNGGQIFTIGSGSGLLEEYLASF